MNFFRWYWRNWEWKDNVIAVLVAASLLSMLTLTLSKP